jgi:hypothetical protein
MFKGASPKKPVAITFSKYFKTKKNGIAILVFFDDHPRNNHK